MFMGMFDMQCTSIPKYTVAYSELRKLVKSVCSNCFFFFFFLFASQFTALSREKNTSRIEEQHTENCTACNSHAQ